MIILVDWLCSSPSLNPLPNLDLKTHFWLCWTLKLWQWTYSKSWHSVLEPWDFDSRSDPYLYLDNLLTDSASADGPSSLNPSQRFSCIDFSAHQGHPIKTSFDGMTLIMFYDWFQQTCLFFCVDFMLFNFSLLLVFLFVVSQNWLWIGLREDNSVFSLLWCPLQPMEIGMMYMMQCWGAGLAHHGLTHC
jgi:hypothetical protein